MNLLITVLIIVGALIILQWSNRWRSERMSTRHPGAGEATDADVEELVRRGRKLTAIKLYREIHKVDLKTAKTEVDRMAEAIKSGTR